MIVLCVRRYLRFSLSYRNIEELMAERNLSVDHVTIWRWVQRYAPELERRCRPKLRMTNRSWRVDETYCRVAGNWTYLYRAVDSSGDTIDFLLSAKRNAYAAKRFFQKALRAPGPPSPTRDQRGWKPGVSQGHYRTEADRRTGSTLSLPTCTLFKQHSRARSPRSQTASQSQSGFSGVSFGVADDPRH